MDAEQKISPLIVDRNAVRLKAWAQDPLAKLMPPETASSGIDAMHALNDPRKAYIGIFLDPLITAPGCLDLLQAAHRYHPATPIFLLQEKTNHFDADELQRLAVQGVVHNPKEYQDLTRHIEMAFLYRDIAQIQGRLQTRLTTSTIRTTADADYVPVRVLEFLSGNPSYFDIYARLQSGRYVKILQANDTFSPDRAAQYLEKGIDTFYIKRDTHQRCLSYCDLLKKTLHQRASMSFELKLVQTLNAGQTLNDQIKASNLNPQLYEQCTLWIAQILTLLHQAKGDQRRAVSALINSAQAYEHAIATLVVALAVTTKLNVESTQTALTVGLAAFLHDVGLHRMSPQAQGEDESKMSAEDAKTYRTHPLVGAELLRGIAGVRETVVQAVAQHHERFDNSGFPLGIDPDQINRVSEVVGIADEYVGLLARAARDSGVKPLALLESEVFPKFSPSIVAAFRSLLV